MPKYNIHELKINFGKTNVFWFFVLFQNIIQEKEAEEENRKETGKKTGGKLQKYIVFEALENIGCWSITGNPKLVDHSSVLYT